MVWFGTMSQSRAVQHEGTACASVNKLSDGVAYWTIVITVKVLGRKEWVGEVKGVGWCGDVCS